ncbi:MAG TPA: response regulator transcription factor, partial [Firmicutes bacterium]|nr:response regulator transcription factor [Bacillota bacterium]
MHARIVVLEQKAQDSADLVQLLTENQYEVDILAPGDASLEELRDMQLDCLFADLSLVESGDGGLLQEIRNDAELESVPVILLSADSSAEGQISALHAGANICIARPYN